MAMEDVQIKHLGHDHPLKLITKEETEDSWDLTCYGCEKPILEMSFHGCKQCQFFLHQSCGDLPPEFTHPFHPQHPLTLLPSPPSTTHSCDICRGWCNKFIYRCEPCDYDIDMKCASVMLTIQKRNKHPSHEHQLMPLLQESMFLCGACGQEHKGTSFLCTTCGLWINQKCASSPLNLKLTNHHGHPLSLSYFISTEDYKSFVFCNICSERIHRRYWVYHCSECRCFIHLHCAMSAKEHSTNNEIKTERLDSTNSMTATLDFKLSKVRPFIYLPLPEDSVDIFTQFIKNTRIEGTYKEAAEIEHFSHDHPLTYFEKPIDLPASRSMSNSSSLLTGERNAGKCDGCAQSISAPFYHCVECNFSLHVWCAELPHKLQHPGHPEHTLSLTMAKYYLECGGCHLFQNIMHYVCSKCSFFLDCKCASLPRVVKHEEHRHNLALRPTSNSKCISCGVPSSVSYECGGCKHYLCTRCALLPRNVRHRYDKLHPFILNYSRLPHQVDDDFCEICEEGIDSNIWFYHCGKCNQYLHKDCVFPPSSRKPYTSKGYTISDDRHQHLLVAVKLLEDLLCSLCKRNVHGDYRAFLCPLCKFCLCYDCWWNDR